MITRLGFVKFVVFITLVFLAGLIAIEFIAYNRHQTALLLSNKNNEYGVKPVFIDMSVRMPSDFESDIKPEQLTASDSKIYISKIPIRKFKISIKKSKKILVRESGEGIYHILLLHGQGSSSKVWRDIGTLQYLSHWGYQAVAIDIPSSESNSLPVDGDKEAVQWLTQLIETLDLWNLVIISPSMSGQLTLPYVFQLNEQQQLLRGFVPIAPAGTQKYSTNNYTQVKIPTLIVHGENDTRFQPAFECLKQIPTSEILLIKNAGHASYSEKPIEFHNALRQFLYNIYRPIYQNSSQLSKTKSKNRQSKKRQ